MEELILLYVIIGLIVAAISGLLIEKDNASPQKSKHTKHVLSTILFMGAIWPIFIVLSIFKIIDNITDDN